MPIYTYSCRQCAADGDWEFERMVQIEDRDAQYCGNGHKLERKLIFTGSVYAKTCNGGMK